MRVLILGGDGYLGWPTAMHLSARGHEVAVVDNFAKRDWAREIQVAPLMPIAALEERVLAWRELTGREIPVRIGDLTNYVFAAHVIREFVPEVVVHYGEQPSAPYSMIDVAHATYTQSNNVIGTLNVLFALRDIAPDTHLIKLGTMGEYGTPNIDIEEGYLDVEHNGRRHEFLYPKTPGSVYHLSKVHDSHNIHFACRVWGLRATELNQGVVYGVETDDSARDPRLATSFYYDEVFGTALNRFCVQAVAGEPITPYGRGGQTRGYLNIRDTMACVELAIRNPADRGELRVYNQFTEQFSVNELATKVAEAATELGLETRIVHAENPRVEAEEHYYNAKHTKLLELGLEPNLLGPELIRSMLRTIQLHGDRIDRSKLTMGIRWAPSIETAPDGTSSRILSPLAGDGLELLSSVETACAQEPDATPHVLFRDWSLEDYARVYLTDLAGTPCLAGKLPRMPSEAVQIRWTGASGAALMNQSERFVTFLKARYESITGCTLSSSTVLDFGASWGRITRLLLKEIDPDQIHACDVWPESVELFNSLNFPLRCELVPARPNELPWPPGTFDLIFLFSVLTHLPDVDADTLMAALHRIISPDGVLVVTIRPEAYWAHVGQGEYARQHQRAGFAHYPHYPGWGDTSMSVDWMAKRWPRWGIVEAKTLVDDPFQVAVILRPSDDRTPD